MTERPGVTASGGAEFERRGARNLATSDSVRSSAGGADRERGRRRDAARGGGRGARGAARARGVSALPALRAPVTVQGIAEHPRVAGRYRVRVAGGLADGAVADGPVAEAVLVLTASGIGDFALRAGRVLDDMVWGRVQREARVVAAQDAALRSLASGRRSERDLLMRGRRREPDATIVAEAVARLRAVGLVDDEAFAAAEAESRLRRGTVATGQVRRELRRRGVAMEVADEAVAAASADLDVDDAARCREAAEKRARQLRGLDAATARRRLTAWLMRRGFAPGVVMPIVRSVLASSRDVAEDDEALLDDDAADE